jgi:hypothetical protein
MTEALAQFEKKTKYFPENLIIYRDGVGDSQRNAVL